MQAGFWIFEPAGKFVGTSQSTIRPSPPINNSTHDQLAVILTKIISSAKLCPLLSSLGYVYYHPKLAGDVEYIVPDTWLLPTVSWSSFLFARLIKLR